MPLYLVRWPNLSAALVSADDDDHLLDVLDEVANPDGCRWTEYHGPVFVDFELPVKLSIKKRTPESGPLKPEEITVGDVSKLARRDWPVVTIPDADTGSELVEALMKFAFPKVHKLFYSKMDKPIDREKLKKAVHDEAMALVSDSWREENIKRSTDPDAKVAAMMDAPPRLVRMWRERAAAMERKAKRQKPSPKKGGPRGTGPKPMK